MINNINQNVSKPSFLYTDKNNYEEFLNEARNNNTSIIGFTSLLPEPDLVLPDIDKPSFKDIDKFIESISNLKYQEKFIPILTGFETEYHPMKEAYLAEAREKVDFLILFQKHVNKGLINTNPTNNPNYPIEYANTVIKALESGLFDIVKFPDYFTKYESTITEENQELYKENVEIASQVICEKARDLNIPIELDLSNANTSQVFVEIASEIDNLQVLINSSHNDNNLYKLIESKIVNKYYSPVSNRQNNKKLQKLCSKTSNNSLTYETHMINQIMKNAFKNIKVWDNPENLEITISYILDQTFKNCVKDANEQYNSIINDPVLKKSEKQQIAKEILEVLDKQKIVLENAKEYFSIAVNLGCNSKKEYLNIITQISQYNSTTSELQKLDIEEHLNRYATSKGLINIDRHVYTLRKEKNFLTENEGSISIFGIVLISIILCILVICLIVYKVIIM